MQAIDRSPQTALCFLRLAFILETVPCRSTVLHLLLFGDTQQVIMEVFTNLRAASELLRQANGWQP